MNISNLRRRSFEILEIASEGDKVSRAFDIFMYSLIVANVFAIVLESLPALGGPYSKLFSWFEWLSVGIFTIEYVLRLWACVERENFQHPFLGRMRFALTPFMIIDLMAIAPFYIQLLVMDLRILRILRLFRIFRLLKLARYSLAVQTFGRVIAKSKEELGISLCGMLLLLLIASALMYFVENGQQPELFSNIPAAMWWAVATLTTVGYGDIYPVTTAGKILGSAISVLGIAMFALPAGILAAAFADELTPEDKIKGNACPHCGKPL